MRCKVEFATELETFEKLVLHGEFRAERVVGVPFLGKGESVVLYLVLRFQRAEDLAVLLVGGAGRVELDAAAGLGLHVELDEPEVEAFAEDITGVLSEIGVRWGSHYLRANQPKSAPLV